MDTMIVGDKSNLGRAITSVIQEAEKCRCMERSALAIEKQASRLGRLTHELVVLLAKKAQQVIEED